MTRSAIDEFQHYISQQRREQEHPRMTDMSAPRERRSNILDLFKRRSRIERDLAAFRETFPDDTPEMLIAEAMIAEEVAHTDILIRQHELDAVQTLGAEQSLQLEGISSQESSQNMDMSLNLEDQVAQHFKESLVAMVNDSVVMMEDMISDSKATIVTLKEHRALVIGQSDAHLATIDENRELVNRQIANEIANTEMQIEALRQHIANLQESRRDQNTDFDHLKNKAQSKRHDDLELVDRMITAEESKLDALVTPKSGSTEIEHQKQARQPTKGKPALVKSEHVDAAAATAHHEPAAVAG